MFVRNTWYVVAFSDEIGPGRPFARTVIGESIVCFRTSDGRVAAMDDRCLHRRMPISLGKVTAADTLVCPYHGLEYNARGECVVVPGQSKGITKCLRAYPAEERYGLVWLWMGDPGQADPDLIFPCPALQDSGLNQVRLYRHAAANYLLLNDNLADLMHVAFLHGTTAGNVEMADARSEMKINGFGYHFIRQTHDIPPPAAYARLATFRGNVDRWHIVDFQAPSFFAVSPGAAEVGTGGPQSRQPVGSGRYTFTSHHLITPESERSLHYFQVNAFALPISSETHRFFDTVIDEDVWVIEHQQRSIDARPNAPVVSIDSDAPTLQMRKLVSQMLAAEARPAPAAAQRA
ncbi:MAG: Rieske 2Fe-2S domain-containing protein [Lautropia sp.]